MIKDISRDLVQTEIASELVGNTPGWVNLYELLVSCFSDVDPSTKSALSDQKQQVLYILPFLEVLGFNLGEGVSAHKLNAVFLDPENEGKSLFVEKQDLKEKMVKCITEKSNSITASNVAAGLDYNFSQVVNYSKSQLMEFGFQENFPIDLRSVLKACVGAVATGISSDPGSYLQP